MTTRTGEVDSGTGTEVGGGLVGEAMIGLLLVDTNLPFLQPLSNGSSATLPPGESVPAAERVLNNPKRRDTGAHTDSL